MCFDESMSGEGREERRGGTVGRKGEEREGGE